MHSEVKEEYLVVLPKDMGELLSEIKLNMFYDEEDKGFYLVNKLMNSGVDLGDLVRIKGLNQTHHAGKSFTELIEMAYDNGFHQLPDKSLSAERAIFEAVFGGKYINCYHSEDMYNVFVSPITYKSGKGFVYGKNDIVQGLDPLYYAVKTNPDTWFIVDKQSDFEPFIK